MFFLFVVMHTANAFYPKELMELAQMASKLDPDSIRKILTDAMAEEISSENKNEESDADEEEKDNREANGASKSEFQSSESRVGTSWLGLNREPSSVYDDPDENDAMYSRESSPNYGKRDDYFESLEKKSQRSTYIPSPRKIFHTPDTMDVSSSSEEEHLREDRRDYRRQPETSKQEDDSSFDVDPAASHPFINSLHLIPAHTFYQPRAMQIPPWRFTEAKAYPKPHIQMPLPLPLPLVSPPPQEVKEPEPKSPPEQSPDPLLTKAAMLKHRGTYKKSPMAPRRPTEVHMTKTHHHNEAKFKPLPRSKSWVSGYKKESVTPKFASHDSSFTPPAGFSRPVRQQFHEQVSLT